MKRNKEDYTKAKCEMITEEEMDSLLENWGIEPINEKTATADFVPAEIIKENAKSNVVDKDDEERY